MVLLIELFTNLLLQDEIDYLIAESYVLVAVHHPTGHRSAWVQQAFGEARDRWAQLLRFVI